MNLVQLTPIVDDSISCYPNPIFTDVYSSVYVPRLCKSQKYCMQSYQSFTLLVSLAILSNDPSYIFFLFVQKISQRKSWMGMIFTTYLALFHSKSSMLFSEVDEFRHLQFFRFHDINKIFTNEMYDGIGNVHFDNDSQSLISGCGVSSSVTFCKDDFIPGT